MGGDVGTGGASTGAGGTSAACAWFTGGSGSMTVAGLDAKFGATWNNPNDFPARVGLTWSSTQSFEQLGTVAADYADTKTGGAESTDGR